MSPGRFVGAGPGRIRSLPLLRSGLMTIVGGVSVGTV